MFSRTPRIFFVALTLAAIFGCEKNPVAVEKPGGPEKPVVTATVTIEVESGESTLTHKVDHVAFGTTLESLLRSSTELPFEITGSGRSAFVNAIDGKTTSGGEGWTYKIDGEFVHAGIGVTKLNPPTTVTWSFGSPTFE